MNIDENITNLNTLSNKALNSSITITQMFITIYNLTCKTKVSIIKLADYNQVLL